MMATADECGTAFERVAARIADVDPASLAEHVIERTISCRVPDLGLTYTTRLHKGGLDPIKPTEEADPETQIRLTVSSDDLVAMVNEELSVTKAWSTGRLRIDASLLDLLRLRRFL